jgi:Mrp family chromosome partitioning ATPase
MEPDSVAAARQTEPQPAPALSLSDIFSGVLAALEKAPSRPAAELAESNRSVAGVQELPVVPATRLPGAAETAAPQTPKPRLDRDLAVSAPPPAVAEPDRFLRAIGDLPSIEIGSPQWPLETQQWVIGSEPWTPSGQPWGTSSVEENDSCDVMNAAMPAEPAAPAAHVSRGVASAAPAAPETRVPARAPRVAKPESVAPSPLPPAPFPADDEPGTEVPGPRSQLNEPGTEVPGPRSQPDEPGAKLPSPPFKPVWQVERFTWPKVCRRLMAKAPEEWDRLCDALLATAARGQKALAIAGCHRGEGATTLLLCAASRLAQRGIKTVLVDADPDRPRLAKRLGVQPQAGWDETSAEDAGGLGRAIVEAADGLAVLPLREPLPQSGRKPLDWPRLADALDALRDHYEIALVDLGPLEDADSCAQMGTVPFSRGIDALLLVCNRRLTSDQQLSETQRRLSAAGITLAGLIENFVAET